MKIIINAEPDEMAHAMALVVEAMPTFARHPERIGWGWTFTRPGGRAFFVRRTKGGFSATPADQGAVAIISSRTERDLPMTVGVEMDLVGDVRAEEMAIISMALEDILGKADADALTAARALTIEAPNAESASRLVERLVDVSERHRHALDLRAWRN